MLLFIYLFALVFYPSEFRLKDSSSWQHVFTSPHIESCIERIAINAKIGQGGVGEANCKMVAISYGSQVRLWGVPDCGTRTNIGLSNLSMVKHSSALIRTLILHLLFSFIF